MTRLGSVAGLVLIAVLSIGLVACRGVETGPPLTDPTEIVTAGLQAAEAAESFHVEVKVDGSVPISLPIGGPGGSIDLDGATLSADVDRTDGAARARFAAPGFLNLSGELVIVDGDAYVRTSMTGTDFRRIELGEVLPLDPTDPAGMIDDLGDLLLGSGGTLVKADDVDCGGGRCYSVHFDLDAAALTALIGPAGTSLPVDLTGASLSLIVDVEQALPHHLAGVTATLATAAGGELVVDIAFSGWDEDVTITAPPADQVAPA